MTSGRKAPPRLGTSNRALQQRARGGESTPQQSVFSSYSPKADSDVMFSTLPRFLHFLFCEGEPSYVSLNYSKRNFQALIDEYKTDAGLMAASIDQAGVARLHILGSAAGRSSRDEELHGKFLAILQNSSEMVERAKSDIRLEFFAQAEINENFEIRILNWYRAIPMVAQARNHSLQAQQNFIRELLKSSEGVSLGELRECESQLKHSSGLLIASAIRGAGAGQWSSDLDIRPLGPSTTFFKSRKKDGS